MVHHLLPSADRSWLLELPFFDSKPAEVLNSYIRSRPTFAWKTWDLQQAELFDWITNTPDAPFGDREF